MTTISLKVPDELVSKMDALAREVPAIQDLMKTYRNIPMSLADACLVRMAE